MSLYSLLMYSWWQNMNIHKTHNEHVQSLSLTFNNWIKYSAKKLVVHYSIVSHRCEFLKITFVKHLKCQFSVRACSPRKQTNNGNTCPVCPARNVQYRTVLYGKAIGFYSTSCAEDAQIISNISCVNDISASPKSIVLISVDSAYWIISCEWSQTWKHSFKVDKESS